MHREQLINLRSHLPKEGSSVVAAAVAGSKHYCSNASSIVAIASAFVDVIDFRAPPFAVAIVIAIAIAAATIATIAMRAVHIVAADRPHSSPPAEVLVVVNVAATAVVVVVDFTVQSGPGS